MRRKSILWSRALPVNLTALKSLENHPNGEKQVLLVHFSCLIWLGNYTTRNRVFLYSQRIFLKISYKWVILHIRDTLGVYFLITHTGQGQIHGPRSNVKRLDFQRPSKSGTFGQASMWVESIRTWHGKETADSVYERTVKHGPPTCYEHYTLATQRRGGHHETTALASSSCH